MEKDYKNIVIQFTKWLRKQKKDSYLNEDANWLMEDIKEKWEELNKD